MPLTDFDLNYAFNAGSDAFLAGREFEDNPYSILTPMYTLWQEGWLDCRDHFGIDPAAKSRRNELCRCPKVGKQACRHHPKGA